MTTEPPKTEGRPNCRNAVRIKIYQQPASNIITSVFPQTTLSLSDKKVKVNSLEEIWGSGGIVPLTRS